MSESMSEVQFLNVWASVLVAKILMEYIYIYKFLINATITKITELENWKN
jgi:hypothetical protein